MPRHTLARARPVILPAVLWLAGALGGCSDGGSAYPSLASRPAERLSDSGATVAVDSPRAAATLGAPSLDLAARLDRLVDQARSAQRDFVNKSGAVEKLVSAAHAARVGSEDWARATQALSGIESARSLTAQPVADLDRFEIDDRLAHPAPADAGNSAQRPDATAIARARATVAALVAEEDEILAKLDGRLAR